MSRPPDATGSPPGASALGGVDPASVSTHRSHDCIDVLGVHVSAVDLTRAADVIDSWVSEGARHYVTVTGVHGVMECFDDAALRDVFNAAGMSTPDGMPMVWAAHHLGRHDVDRVYGPDLFALAAERGAASGRRFYYYGGVPGVAEEVADTLAARHPGLETAGTGCPPFRDLRDDELGAVAEQINAAAPDIVWIGISTPKQERLMARLRPIVDAPVLIGVGAAFDFAIGRVTQAPRWVQRSGLEWLFRLVMEPRRLWRRYMTHNPRFVYHILRRRPTVIPARP